MLQKPIITDWTAGELSELMAWRIELELYNKGCSVLENWLVLRQGCITTRPGSKYIVTAKGQAILLPFIINDITSYMLEVGPLYIRVLDGNDEYLMQGDAPMEIVTPYATLQHVRELHVAQDGNTLYFAHQSYRPSKLELSLDGITWAFSTIPVTGNAGLVPFQPLGEGEDLGNWPGSVAIFGGRLFFGGTPNEPQTVWASEVFDYSSFKYFETVAVTTQEVRDSNWTFEAVVTAGSGSVTGVSDSAMEKLKVGDTIEGGAFPDGTKIATIGTNAFTAANNATSTGLVTLTMKWPNPDEPDYQNVTTARDLITDSSAMKFKLGSDQLERIQWMASGKDLVVGGSTSEFIIPSGVTALAPRAVQQTRHGSSRVQGRMFKDAVVFVQGGGKNVLDYPYYNEQGAYQAADLSFHAEGVLGPGIISMDFAQTPQPMLFCVRSDGELSVLVYDKVYQVMAWSRFVTSGFYESVAVGQAPDGRDVVYAIVRRGAIRTIEKLDPVRTLAYSLDCWKSFASGAPLTGLTMFANGTTVKVVSGDIESSGTITDGEVVGATVKPGHTVYVGLGYDCIMRTNRITTQSQYGVGQGNIRRVSAVNVRFLNSYPVRAVFSEELDGDEALFEALPFTGMVKIPYNGDWDTDGWVTIKQSRPRPATILSMIPEVDAE